MCDSEVGSLVYGRSQLHRAPPPPPRVVKGFTQFNLFELKAATNDFSERKCIGKGSFCNVYKGRLHDRRVVAIKKQVLNLPSRDDKHIYNEVNIVSEINHKNIVRCLGYCHEIKVALVCLDDEYIGDKQPTYCNVKWPTRFQIIKGIAQGVHYLHEQRIVHLDLKHRNILLDCDMNPKISDFGTAKRLGHDDEITSHSEIIGTPGFTAPEYVHEHIISMKCDVYGFGVTLLWTISGYEAGRMEALSDPSLCDESQLMEAKMCMEVGLLCTQLDRNDRPTMADVLAMLNGRKELRKLGELEKVMVISTENR
ncbi:hypothetical protein PVAP13_3KG565700 [Panicum virgatum]|uniref:non-specific serine/threonine protein kinase n=1 Tax=Panicum virgatum TaxID=38727 RepID=A0A8T0V7X9_PANVG|nr:hypothetical protein PVAP13_3KG565700 [Panicum virgatum]